MFFTADFYLLMSWYLVGLQEAAQMITTGKTLKADKAKKAGLVDLVVDPACLESVAIQQVLCT